MVSYELQWLRYYNTIILYNSLYGMKVYVKYIPLFQNHDSFLAAVENEVVFKTLDVECPPDEVEYIREQEAKMATNVIASHKPDLCSCTD